jgi:hypothetical protein
MVAGGTGVPRCGLRSKTAAPPILNLFPGYADTTLLGHFDFQFYGSAAGRTYSAQAALLF